MVLKDRMTHPPEVDGIGGGIAFSSFTGWGSQGPQTGQAQGSEWLSGACLMYNHEIRAQRGKGTCQESHSKVAANALFTTSQT